MKRIDHLAIKDVLRKRKSKTLGLCVETVEIDQPTLLSSNKQMTCESIIQKILKIQTMSNHRCDLNLQQRYTIIQHISDKESISYNRNTLAALMTVWRCPAIHYTDNSVEDANANESVFGDRVLRNFFVLHGSVTVYDKNWQQQIVNAEKKYSQQIVFETQSKLDNLRDMVQGQQPRILLEEGSGWGPLFRKKQQQNRNVILKINNAILIQVKQPELEGMLVNLGGMDQEKKQKIIQQFPIFSSISKKILSILPYIQLKKYTRNQFIFKIKQQPQAIYLILKGQIIFQVRIQIPKQKKSFLSNKSLPNQFVMQTQSLGIGNYFGEEQIIFPSSRNVNTICNSAECDLLEIPVQKFSKLLAYNDFYEQLKTSAEVKIAKRKQKVAKALQIYLTFNKSPQKQIQSTQVQLKEPANLQNSKKISRKKSTEPVKMMHGNIIRKIPNLNTNEVINFSMLGANPDMYQSTLNKFRKYTMKPVQKQKPQVNWNLKRVWKVLNLQNILRDDGEVTSPEGRKFYESHRRLQNHVQQVKSLRPKTSSSTYRTKLQYIAYLQQFNN